MFESVTTTAMLIYLIFLLLGLLVLTLIVLLVHSGIFYRIDDIGTGKPPIGQVIIAYKFHKGPYNQAGQTFTEAAVIAPHNKTLGIYYDDPSKVEPQNQRYAVASILCSGSDPVPEDQVKTFTAEGFKILHLPEVTFAVRTKFPHITSLSILIGIYKAYPDLKEYIEERKLCAYPFMEYYDGEHIHFMVPLSKQDEFIVPECKDGYEEGVGDADSSVNTTQDSLLSNTQGSVKSIDTSLLNTTPTDTSLLNTTQESQEEESLLNTTQDSDAGAKDSQLNTTQESQEDGSLLNTAQESVALTEPSLPGPPTSINANQSNSGWAPEDRGSSPETEGLEDEHNLSDGSSSSFEVVKEESINP